MDPLSTSQMGPLTRSRKPGLRPRSSTEDPSAIMLPRLSVPILLGTKATLAILESSPPT
jgi:hypothetical protein